MSTAGFQVWGQNGNLQLDASTSPLILAAKGTINAYSSSYNYPGRTINSFPYFNQIQYANTRSRNPLLVLAPNSGWPAFVSRFGIDSNNTATWSVHLYIQDGSQSDATVPLNYWIFDTVPNVETHTGLNIYNSSGTVIYNSDYKPLRIQAVADTPTGVFYDGTSSPSGFGSISAPSGSYGGFVLSPRYYHNNAPTVYQPFWRESFLVSSTGMNTTYSRVGNTKDYGMQKTSPAKMFLVNVSGY